MNLKYYLKDASDPSLKMFMVHQAPPDDDSDSTPADSAQPEAVVGFVIGGEKEEFPCLRGGSCGYGDWRKNCWNRYHRDLGVGVQPE